MLPVSHDSSVNIGASLMIFFKQKLQLGWHVATSDPKSDVHTEKAVQQVTRQGVTICILVSVGWKRSYFT